MMSYMEVIGELAEYGTNSEMRRAFRDLQEEFLNAFPARAVMLNMTQDLSLAFMPWKESTPKIMVVDHLRGICQTATGVCHNQKRMVCQFLPELLSLLDEDEEYSLPS